ncbi:MAG: hypothetical protein HW416_1571 [Chloroflexi bacterium]|nr:hypothetical protein [Chloroflexota bacterium]
MEWDRLTDALNDYGIVHVAPGADPDQPGPHDPTDLFLALWSALAVRLQEAAVVLLLTYPELAPAAQAAIARLTGREADRARRRYVASCALQRMWRTRVQITLGVQPLIPPAYLGELGLPSLDDDLGRATLLALARQEESLYGYNAWAGYTSLMALFLQEIQLKGWGRKAARVS